MDKFISRFADKIIGVLSGFDRLVFRGHLLPLMRDGGMYIFLNRAGVRLLDFKDYVLKTSTTIKEAAIEEAKTAKRPIHYLESSRTSKENLARQALEEHPIDQGMVCLFKTVETCRSFEYHRSQDKSERGLRLATRKCLHLYKYFVHPTFGFMNARLQTWFPFTVQICINGREWLARALERNKDLFLRDDNCITWFASPQSQVQRLFDQQLETDWPSVLGQVARLLNPLHQQIFEPCPMDYYWSVYQSEWATDVLFEDPQSLAAIYPGLVHHAMYHLQSPDIMRFLGKKLTGNFKGEVVTSFKRRPEGVRVKHWVAGNSIKMYDKARTVLRGETTIGNVTPFKVFRPADDDQPDRKLAWRPMRKGVADLHRRAQVSQQANQRYLEALAATKDDTKVAGIFDQVSRPTTFHGHRVRALRIGDHDDLALLKAIARGEWTVPGFRNRDLRQILHPTKRVASVGQARKLSARISRQLRLLRAHGIIKKVPKSHRYRITEKGLQLTTALFAAREATVENLIGKAAA
jgi:hypothetical protein